MSFSSSSKVVLPSVKDLKYKFLMTHKNSTVEKMLREEGHTFTYDVDGGDYDIALFLGGEDVSPWLYGQRPHPKTTFNMARDLFEIKLLQRLPSVDFPKVGICRGGQFLNVMSGGSLWQHVDGHVIKDKHWAETHQSEKVMVTSTHHQMMRPRKDALLLMWSDRSSRKEDDTTKIGLKDAGWDDMDIEACFYYHTNSLCFQPHPEYDGIDSSTRQVFWSQVRDFLGPDVMGKRERMAKAKLSLAALTAPKDSPTKH